MTKKIARLSLFVLLIAFVVRCADRNQVALNGLQTDVFDQNYTDHNYDFLFIVDNSSSMIPMIQFVKNHIQAFIDHASTRKAINFQMAVATTDYFTEEGKLRANTIGQKLVKSSDPNPVNILGTILDKLITDINNNVGNPADTSFWERPLDTLRTAMVTYSGEFTRNGTDTIAFILSDENDFSCGPNPRSSPKCSNVAPGTNPIPAGGAITYERPADSYFTTILSQLKASQKAILHVVPIVGLNEADCEIGSVATDTLRIAAAINGAQPGAIKAPGSICESKIEAAFEAVASQLADRGLAFKLSALPKVEIFSVTVDGVVKPQLPNGDWQYEAATNSIVFATSAAPKRGARIVVSYAKKS